MTLKVTPSYNEVGWSDRWVKEVEFATHDRVDGMLNHVSGFAVTGIGGLDITIGVGSAKIYGYLIENDELIPEIVRDNTTNYVFLKFTLDLTGRCNECSIEVNNTGVAPDYSTKLATITTASGAITNLVDNRVFDAFNATGGHNHSGTAGNGPLILGRNITPASTSTGVAGLGSVRLSRTPDHADYPAVLSSTEKGSALGVCPLDSNILVALSNIPTPLTGKSADMVDSKHSTDLMLLDGTQAMIGDLQLDYTIAPRVMKWIKSGTDKWQLKATDSAFTIYDSINSRNVLVYTQSTNALDINTATLTHLSYTIWDSNNDGSGSGCDADMVDGNEAAAFMFLDGSNSTMLGDLKLDYNSATRNIIFVKSGVEKYKIYANDTELKIRDTIGSKDIIKYTEASNTLALGAAAGTTNLIGTNIQVNGVPLYATCVMQTEKDAVNGVPFLDANGELQILGNIFRLTRDPSANTMYLQERTSGEGVLKILRDVADDYIPYIRSHGTWRRLGTSSEENELITQIKYSQVTWAGNDTSVKKLPATPLVGRKKMVVKITAGYQGNATATLCNANGTGAFYLITTYTEAGGRGLYDWNAEHIRTFYFDPDIPVDIYAKGSGGGHALHLSIVETIFE